MGMRTGPSFSELLRDCRLAAALTQEALAERAGISARNVRALERGGVTPQRDTARRLATALGLGGGPLAAFMAAAVPAPRDRASSWEHSRHHTVLPIPPTALVGREQELVQLARRLADPACRLVTLCGPGGVGKTRLGLQVVAAVADHFADGVAFVNLAPIADPALVASTIAQTLNIRQWGGSEALDLLKAYLRDKQVLLLLDNFEQVIAAVPVVAELLAAAPRLKALVTSRVVLQLRAEHVFTVPPLALPDLRRLPSVDRLTQYAAVRLYVERAQAAKSDFALSDDNAAAVVEVCLRLDGLPLAIELAARRVNLLAPRAMLARLSSRLELLTGGARDLPARQQTLRTAIAWSYDLLDAGEQMLFRRLAVFVGGFTLEAAEGVCNVASALGVLEGVQSLIDKSLLWQHEAPGGEPRYTMLETIREFALERLQVAGEVEDVRDRHLEFFLALAEEAEPRLHGAEQLAWVDRLETEHDNLRAALGWSLAGDQSAAVGLRLASALIWFWMMRGYLTEGGRWLEDVLDQPGASARTGSRARALLAAGIAMTHYKVNDARRQMYLEESLAIGRELGEERHIAICHIYLGATLAALGNPSGGRALVEGGLRISRELGERWLVATALDWLRHITEELGDYDVADAAAGECVVLNQALGNTWGLATALSELGRRAAEQGDYVLAQSVFQQSLAVFRQLRSRSGIVEAQDGLATATMRAGDYRVAQTLFEEVLPMAREIGHPLMVHALAQLGWVALCVGDAHRATDRFTESLTLYREVADGKEIAWMLRSLGYAAQQQGDLARALQLFVESLVQARVAGLSLRTLPINLAAVAQAAALMGQAERAARLFGAVEMLNPDIGVHLYAHTAGIYAQGVAAARSQLGDEQFGAFYTEGQRITLEQAIAYALEESSEE